MSQLFKLAHCGSTQTMETGKGDPSGLHPTPFPGEPVVNLYQHTTVYNQPPSLCLLLLGGVFPLESEKESYL